MSRSWCPSESAWIDRIEEVVISFYAKGMSMEDISRQVNELYGVPITSSTVSNIIERILVDVSQWQQRALDGVYLVLWLDGIVFKVRHEGKITNKSIHIIAGLNTDGRKEVLGLRVGEGTGESASFWLNTLTDLRARGVAGCADCLFG